MVGLFPAEFWGVFGVFDIQHFLFIFEGETVAFPFHGIVEGLLFLVAGVVEVLLWMLIHELAGVHGH